MVARDLRNVSHHLFLCNGDHCTHLGAVEGTKAIRKAIEEKGMVDQVHTTKTLCNGRCLDGPIVIAMPGYVWYKQMTHDKARDFVQAHLIDNIHIEDQILHTGIKDTNK